MPPPSNEPSITEKTWRVLLPYTHRKDHKLSKTTEFRLRLVSIISIFSIPAFILAQLTESLYPPQVPLHLSMALAMFVGYFLARYGHIKHATGLVIITFSQLPYSVLIINGLWTVSDTMFMMIWLAMTQLVGSLLLPVKWEDILALIHNVLFAATVVFHSGINILAVEGLGRSIFTLAGISLLIITGAHAIETQMNMLREQREELDESNRELDIYASLLIHDLSNDLQVVSDLLDLTDESAEHQDARVTGFLHRARGATGRMASLLKAFSESPSVIKADIVKIVQDCASKAKKTHENLTIDVEVNGEFSDCRYNSRLLPMVFDNLFRNTAQHCGDSPTVTVSFSRNNDIVKIDIVDDGPGIEPEIRDDIFTRKVPDEEGSGIGLFLVKRILQLYDGDIELHESAPDRGCYFTIEMPCDGVP